MEKNTNKKLIQDQFEDDWRVCKGKPEDYVDKGEYKLVSEVQVYDDEDFSFDNIEEFPRSWQS